jgi:hypothetical protein
MVRAQADLRSVRRSQSGGDLERFFGRWWEFLEAGQFLGWGDGYHACGSTGSRIVEEPPFRMHGRSAPHAHHVRATPDSSHFDG